jgi:hypothetical protein
LSDYGKLKEKKRGKEKEKEKKKYFSAKDTFFLLKIGMGRQQIFSCI